jgi:hypothetical protein
MGDGVALTSRTSSRLCVLPKIPATLPEMKVDDQVLLQLPEGRRHFDPWLDGDRAYPVTNSSSCPKLLGDGDVDPLASGACVFRSAVALTGACACASGQASFGHHPEVACHTHVAKAHAFDVFDGEGVEAGPFRNMPRRGPHASNGSAEVEGGLDDIELEWGGLPPVGRTPGYAATVDGSGGV